MATRRLFFSPSALADLQEMLVWYREQGVEAVGHRIAGELLDAAGVLPEHPEMGRIVPEFDTPTLRELIRPPYRIVYRLDADRIAIIRIWRSERLLKMPGADS